MTWRIRDMSESDIDKVYAIETSVHIAPWSKDILRDCVLVGYKCLVLEIQVLEQWVLGGYMICRHKTKSCHILNFCIAKRIQSKGYGRKFLQYVINEFEQYKNIEEMVLEVRPSNKVALHLYESMGFIRVELKQGYYQDKDQVEDAIFLKKIIRPKKI